jgi:hypothetical protein
MMSWECVVYLSGLLRPRLCIGLDLHSAGVLFLVCLGY